MTKLEDILRDTSPIEVKGPISIDITTPSFDSRKIESGSLYVAVPGTQVDGHVFIDKAIAAGARVVVCETFPADIRDNVTYVKVESSSAALGQIAANFYGRPSERMKLVGVTGTNGKTTTVTLLHRIFSSLGHRAGLLSTIRNQIGERTIPSTHTTPDAIQINSLMQDMVTQGCSHCFMEVTSHAVVQNRVAGLSFAGGVFTNLTHDHLDYHGTMENYFAAKRQFFDTLHEDAFALSNIDDDRGELILRNTSARKKTYSLKSEADFRGEVVSSSASGLVLSIDGNEIRCKLLGKFNAYNILAAYGASVLLGAESASVLEALAGIEPVEGRFDLVTAAVGVTGIVDFAHTPDGLEHILADVRELTSEHGRLITVLGCGGDRDQEKRPKMGTIAYDGSDVLILTSDNPRSEDPAAIIEEMRQGIPHPGSEKLFVVVDRREAIRRACALARPGDAILVAGRGHEAFQLVGAEKIPFSDKAVLQEALTGAS